MKIPKISKFDFFDIMNGADGGYGVEDAIFYLISDPKEYCSPQIEDPNLEMKFEIQNQLFSIVANIHFRIYNYGIINFLSNYTKEIPQLDELITLIKLYYEDENLKNEVINDIKKGTEFYKNHIEDLKIANDFENPNQESTFSKLKEKIDFHFGTMIIINEVFDCIQENTDDFCRDENGNSIDPSYSGKLIIEGNINKGKTIYNLENGVFRGEKIEYFSDNSRIKKITIEGGITDKTVKEWYENGQLKHKLKGYSSNLNRRKKALLSDFIEWYENGAVKSEKTNDYFISWYKNGQIKSEFKGNSGKYWTPNGDEVDFQVFCDNYVNIE